MSRQLSHVVIIIPFTGYNKKINMILILSSTETLLRFLNERITISSSLM